MKRAILRMGLIFVCLVGIAGAEPLRALNTDRPDQTESPFTVDAGHAQFEMDFVNYTQDTDRSGGGDVLTRTTLWAPFNLRMGVTPRLEAQLLFEPQVQIVSEDRVANLTQRVAGPGELTARMKFNLWGNDAGATALGLLPWVKLPLSANGVRNGEPEFGLVVPYAAELDHGWDLGAQIELARVRDDALRTVTRGLVSVVVGHGLTADLSGYLEILAQTESGPGAHWQVQFDCGLTYVVNENLQVDAGCNFGLTNAAPDWQPFVGISRRF